MYFSLLGVPRYSLSKHMPTNNKESPNNLIKLRYKVVGNFLNAGYSTSSRVRMLWTGLPTLTHMT